MHIDLWTLLLQTTNVVILVWLLSRFLYRPVVAIIDRRQEEAHHMLAEAAAAHRQADDAHREAERMRATVVRERQRAMADMHRAAEAEHAVLLARAHEDLAKLRAEAELAMANDRAVADTSLIDRAQELAIEMARRLLARLPAALNWEPYLEGVCTEVAARSDRIRAAISGAHGQDQAIEVITATPLGPEDSERVRAAIERAFGSRQPLSFRSDPDVIAGIELKSRHVTIRNSLAADLEKIAKELQHDNEQCDGVGRLAQTGEAHRRGATSRTDHGGGRSG